MVELKTIYDPETSVMTWVTTNKMSNFRTVQHIPLQKVQKISVAHDDDFKEVIILLSLEFDSKIYLYKTQSLLRPVYKTPHNIKEAIEELQATWQELQVKKADFEKLMRLVDKRLAKLEIKEEGPFNLVEQQKFLQLLHKMKGGSDEK